MPVRFRRRPFWLCTEDCPITAVFGLLGTLRYSAALLLQGAEVGWAALVRRAVVQERGPRDRVGRNQVYLRDLYTGDGTVTQAELDKLSADGQLPASG